MCRINKQGGNRHLKNVTQTQQQRPGLPMVTLTWHVSKYEEHELHQRYILSTGTWGKLLRDGVEHVWTLLIA